MKDLPEIVPFSTGMSVEAERINISINIRDIYPRKLGAKTYGVDYRIRDNKALLIRQPVGMRIA